MNTANSDIFNNIIIKPTPIFIKALILLLWSGLLGLTIYCIIRIDKDVTRNEPQLAKLKQYSGAVEYRSADLIFWMNVISNQPLYEGDIIATGKDGYATISLKNGETLDILPNSQIQISEKQNKEKMDFIVTLLKGYVVAQTQNPSLPKDKTISKSTDKNLQKTNILIKTDEQNIIALQDIGAKVEVYKSIAENKVHITKSQGEVIIQTKTEDDKQITVPVREYTNLAKSLDTHKTPNILIHQKFTQKDTISTIEKNDLPSKILTTDIQTSKENELKDINLKSQYTNNIEQESSKIIQNISTASQSLLQQLQKKEEASIIASKLETLEKLTKSLNIKPAPVKIALKEHTDINKITQVKEHQILYVPSNLNLKTQNINLARLTKEVHFSEEQTELDNIIKTFEEQKITNAPKEKELETLKNIEVENKSNLPKSQDKETLTKLSALTPQENIENLIKTQMPILENKLVKAYWTNRSLYDSSLMLQIKVMPPLISIQDTNNWKPLIGVKDPKSPDNRILITFKGKNKFTEQMFNLNISKIMEKIKLSKKDFGIKISLIAGLEKQLENNNYKKFFSNIVEEYEIYSLTDINKNTDKIKICFNELKTSNLNTDEYWTIQQDELPCNQANYQLYLKKPALAPYLFSILKNNQFFSIKMNVSDTKIFKNKNLNCLKNAETIAILKTTTPIKPDDVSIIQNLLNADFCTYTSEDSIISMKNYSINQKKSEIIKNLSKYNQIQLIMSNGNMLTVTDVLLKVQSQKLLDTITKDTQGIIVDSQIAH